MGAGDGAISLENFLHWHFPEIISLGIQFFTTKELKALGRSSCPWDALKRDHFYPAIQ